MVAEIPTDAKIELDLSFAIADRIDKLIKKRGLTKKEFAASIGKRPSEVTKWLSGQHNFTIRTIAMISAYFGEPLILPIKSSSLEKTEYILSSPEIMKIIKQGEEDIKNEKRDSR